MLDTIDLKEQLERGNKILKRPGQRRLRMWLAIVAIIALAGLLYFLSQQPDLGQIYDYRDGELIEISERFPTEFIEIAPDGRLWAAHRMFRSLYYYDGANWQQLNDAGFGLNLGVNSIAFHGNEIWVSKSEDVAVFDGTTWQLYENVMSTRDILSIQAGSFGVAVLDNLGNIAIFRDGEWQHDNVANFLGFEVYKDYPYVSMISDGEKLFVSGNGMAVYDGTGWQTVSDYDAYSLIIGQDENNIWLANYSGDNSLMELDKSSYEYTVYNGSKTGFSESAWVWELRELDGRWVFGSDEGFVEYDGRDWSRIDIPIDEIGIINDFELGTNRSLILAGLDRNIWSDTVKIVVLGLSQLAGLPILLLIFVPAIYYWRKASKEKKDRIELTEKRLPSLFPNKAEQEPVAGHERVPTKQWLGRYLTFAYVLIVYALMFTAAITGHFFLGILAYDLMIYTISQAVLLFKSKSEPLVYRHVLTMMLLCLLIFVATAIPGTFISEAIGQAMGFDRVAYSIIMLACAFVLTLWQILAIQRADFYFSNNYLRSPLKKGDFQEGLKLSEALLKQNPGHPDLLFLKGWIFYQLGQAEAAEKIYRELIENAKKSPPEFIAPCLINLSAALQLQGKYDEALPFLEAAVKIRPEYVTAYREMALWYLEQNLFPERALEMTEVMLHFDKKPRSNFLGQRFMWAWNHAAHALALAKTGQREDALSFMQQAVEGNDNHDFVAKWSILLSKADIHRALGDKVEAKAIYQQILAIEPRFVVHQYAEKGLAQLDASIA